MAALCSSCLPIPWNLASRHFFTTCWHLKQSSTKASTLAISFSKQDFKTWYVIDCGLHLKHALRIWWNLHLRVTRLLVTAPLSSKLKELLNMTGSWWDEWCQAVFCRAACCKQHWESHLTHPASANPMVLMKKKKCWLHMLLWPPFVGLHSNFLCCSPMLLPFVFLSSCSHLSSPLSWVGHCFEFLVSSFLIAVRALLYSFSLLLSPSSMSC